ncbi:MAG: tRNA pseudouridine(55) synthase TruB [Rhodospirillales bacterium]|nr:tRNA pseudouridine(55) synthase TruB [Rhodospirillales bacterium]
MARRRKGRPISGWVILDKPLGMSSSQAVGAVRRVLDAQKAGHGGTLDPLATGILPIALGEATKTVSYAMDGSKTYHFTVQWGEARTTLDREGEITETSTVRPSQDEITNILPEFTGQIEQVPPVFSAIKVDGQRAYQLARENKDVELKPRTVSVHRIELLDVPDADHATFKVDCGKGTYIRSLARDIACSLGTVGHVSELRRTRVGPFNESAAISLDKLNTLGHSSPPDEAILPIETVLDDIPALALTEEEARQIRHGQAISALSVATRSPLTGIEQDDVICAMNEGQLVALVQFVGGEIRPVRVLNQKDTLE